MVDQKFVRNDEASILAHLSEESAEVIRHLAGIISAVGKTQRWGLASYDPRVPEDQRETNRAWILREIALLQNELIDLKLVIDRFNQHIRYK